MKAVIDTCVVIDALQSREPFCKKAQAIFLLCANRAYDGFLSAKAVTDVYYLTSRSMHSGAAAKEVLAKLCELFSLLDTTSLDVRKAIAAETGDFEDAVMIETAVRSHMDCIVTRNRKDFIHSPIPVYDPVEFIGLLNGDAGGNTD